MVWVGLIVVVDIEVGVVVCHMCVVEIKRCVFNEAR